MRSKWSIVALMLFMLPPRICGGRARFEQTDVFISGQDNIHTYRIPAIICSPKGTLLAFSEGRRAGAEDGVATDLVLKRSLQNGKPISAGGRDWKPTELAWNTIWRPMQTLIRSAHGEAYMNPVPLIDKSDGTIFLFVNYYPQPYEDIPAQIWLLRSRDEGATWTHPVDITPMVGKHELGPGTGIELRSGRLMVAVYDGAIFSDDHGNTWKPSDAAPGIPNEDQIAERNDGTLLLNRRHRGYREILRSKDQGQTWSEPEPDRDLPDADCQGSLIRYTGKDRDPAKNILLFSNPVAGLPAASITDSDPRGRFNLTIRVSYDGGRTWPLSKTIRRGPSAYSSITELPDGSIGVLYEYGDRHEEYFDHYQKLVFARFNLDWLKVED